MKFEFSQQIFEKNSNIIFYKNPCSWSPNVAWGQTDRSDEANSSSSQLCERAWQLKSFPAHAMKASIVGDETRKHSLLTWAIDDVKSSISRPGRFNSRKEFRFPIKRRMGGPWTGTDVTKKIILFNKQCIIFMNSDLNILSHEEQNKPVFVAFGQLYEVHVFFLYSALLRPIHT